VSQFIRSQIRLTTRQTRSKTRECCLSCDHRYPVPRFTRKFQSEYVDEISCISQDFTLLACTSRTSFTMAQPSTPSGGPHSIFGPGASNANQLSTSTALTPSSATSSNNTFLMPNSPVKGRLSMDGYRPKVTRTLGQRPACLVNASVTYCGNNQIYAFGGFDQYTDEVYNHVLKLDMVSHQWSLVDNYGDIPGVRMGMTLFSVPIIPS
jgi:hypothetical protein